MGTIEVAYELKDVADVMVASENAVISDGWPYGKILESFNSGNAVELGKLIVDKYYESNRYGLPMSMISLKQIGSVTEAIKTQGNVLEAINNTVVYERHGEKWNGSHGLAIYFPRDVLNFESNYNRINFATETGWSGFLSRYYEDVDVKEIEIRANAKQCFDKNYVDTYDLFQRLLKNEEFKK
jgi:hypothetical protein